MDTVDSVDLRAIEKLKRDMGRSLMEALEDPETLEIMLNPDGKLWREKFGQPMFCMGTVPVQRSKTIIQTIAGFHKKIIDSNSPFLECELPIDGSRFAGQLPPLVAGPTFAIRKKASRIFLLDEYVDKGVMTRVQADFICRAIAAHKNILVIGAHGQTGRQVVAQLKENADFTPVAGVRSQSQVKEFTDQGIEVRVVDVRQSVTEIKKSLDNIDAIVISIGGGWMVDLDGKVKIYQAAEQAGIKRVVLVSAGAIQHFHDEKKLAWMDEWEEYSAAMYYADILLQQSNLDYTIVRPENLTNEPGTGKVTIGDYLPHNYISRANVSTVIVDSLGNDNTIRKAFDVEDGATPVSQAIEKI